MREREKREEEGRGRERKRWGKGGGWFNVLGGIPRGEVGKRNIGTSL